MTSLYARMSLALLAIFIAVGGGFFLIERWSTRLYHEELTQRLNSSIAMYVTDQTPLIEDGVVNLDALHTLADRAMVINPTVEVYLLGKQGRVLAHAMPSDTVQLEQVDLAPLRAFIDGTAKMPLHGMDPASPGRAKVFSAAEVRQGDELQGYLYVVLGGQKYDALAHDIRGSYVQALSLGAIVALVLAAFLAGLVVFALLTRRLRRLTREVRRFAHSGLDPEAAGQLALPEPPADGGDEIHELSAAFVAMADKIREQFEGLKETDRLRRELVSNVSHDLRTPLASMHGYVDTLLLKNRELSADERERYLEITREHTRRLSGLVGDLFQLSTLEAAGMSLDLEPFSLAELLHDVAQEFELEAQRRDITIEVESSPGAAMVTADIALVQRVLENLLRNALKFTPEGGRVTLGLSPAESGVTVAVADTGCGIPADRLDRIFDRFYRSDDHGNGHEDSAGLGLAIVKRILELHGSRITVTSAVGEGTRFEFELPSAA